MIVKLAVKMGFLALIAGLLTYIFLAYMLPNM